MSARILLVSYHFYPDAAVGARRMSELARELLAAGHEVWAVCGDPPPERRDAALSEHIQGVHRLAIAEPVAPRPRRRVRPGAAGGQAAATRAPEVERESLQRRVKRWYHSAEWLLDNRKSWAWHTARRIKQLASRMRFDCVISSGPPMAAHVAVRAVQRRLACPWLLDLRDPWTDDKEWMAHVQSALSRRVEAALEAQCLKAATRIVTSTAPYAERLRRRYPHQQHGVETIYNGYDGPLTDLGPPPAGALRLLYAGSIYYHRNPFPLLKALGALLERAEVNPHAVHFEMIGHCEQWQGQALRPWLEAAGLTDQVLIRDPVPADQVRQHMAAANVLVNFAQRQPRQIPAKMFEYLAANRDMLLLTEAGSATAELAERAGVTAVDPDDERALAETIWRLYQYHAMGVARPVKAARAAPEQFSRAHQNRLWLARIATELGAPALTVPEPET